MFFGLYKLAMPFLLASSSSPPTVSQKSQSQPLPKPVDTAPIVTKESNNKNGNNAPALSLKDIRAELDQIYADLVDQPGRVTKPISPTMTFSYVSSPTTNGTSTWRASSPLDVVEEEDNSNNPDQPILIYLPGLDGTGISAFTHQFDDLASVFEVWRLVITTDDRSEFRTILKNVVDFVEELVANSSTTNGKPREVVLVGESFGGVLASAVALNLQKRASKQQKTDSKSPLTGLVLVNPATAFHDTNWDTIVPLLASLQYLSDRNDNSENNNINSTLAQSQEKSGPSPYAIAGGMALSYLMPDGDQLSRIGELIFNSLGATGTTNPSLKDVLGLFEILEERLPAETLQHRVNQWLSVGTTIVNERLPGLQVPTLVVVGDQDRIMPSDKEVGRLMEVIPSCEKLVVRGRGHFVLDETVNLTEAILFSNIDPLKQKQQRKYDPITDWSLPPQDEINDIFEQQVKPTRNIHSPVFFSTDVRGKRWRGLSKLPRPDTSNGEGPILFVANHQFFGLDLNLIIGELLEECDLVCRGLAHPVVFNQTSRGNPELHGRTPGLVSPVGGGRGRGGGNANSFSTFEKFGAVAVTPRNYYRLMQSGQNALLFPGGVKDVFQTDSSYPLLWPDKPDFVRTAARFNATIVPLSAVGMLDSARVLVEARNLERIPFLGKRISEAGGFPAARFDAPEGERDPLPPIPLPSMPKRNYFVFGKPFSTSDIDPKDKEACAKLYKDVVGETRRGLDDILSVREQDPFYDTPRRVAYEQVTKKQAPTISVEKLNRK